MAVFFYSHVINFFLFFFFFFFFLFFFFLILTRQQDRYTTGPYGPPTLGSSKWAGVSLSPGCPFTSTSTSIGSLQEWQITCNRWPQKHAPAISPYTGMRERWQVPGRGG